MMDTNYTNIVNEWFAKLEKGYAIPPYSDHELSVLSEVLESYDLDVSDIVTEAEPTADAQDNQLTISKIQELELSDDVKDAVIRTYNQLSKQDKSNFDKYFRKSTIQQYVSSTHKYFKPFVSIVPSDTSRGGMGKGEVAMILAIDKSRSGGTQEHDVIIGNQAWEVKQLVAGKFDPAKDGSAYRFQITQDILDFYKDIVYPLQEIDDPFDAFKSIVNEDGHAALKQILEILDTKFLDIIDKENLLFKFEWKVSAMINWYEGFIQLNELLKKQSVKNNVTDTRVTVTAKGADKSFWISDDDAEDIEQGSQKNEPISVVVGQPVDSDNKQYILWFKKLERNNLINNPKLFINGLNDVKRTFFNGIAGLVWFDNNFDPNISDGSDFAVANVSQARYRFIQKSHSSAGGKKYIQDQE